MKFSSKTASSDLGFFGWLGIIGIIAIIGSIACCTYIRPGKPPVDTLADEKAALQNLRNLTDAQDRFFLRNEKMAASITELEWGGDFDTHGCIIWKDIWNSRGEERSKLKGPYAYYTLPVISTNGEIDPFSFCVAAVPVEPFAASHPVMISLVGPVKNALAFKRPWPFKRIWRVDAIRSWSDQIATEKPIPRAQYDSINSKQANTFEHVGYAEADETGTARTPVKN